MLSTHHRQHIRTISDTFGGKSAIQQLDNMNSAFNSGVEATNTGHEATAVSIFDNILLYNNRSLLVPLLIRRSVLCREMNNFGEALRSAQGAIQLDNTNTDGHIAAVKVLVAQCRLPDALRQCQIGLSCVLSSDKRRMDLQLLQQQLYEDADRANQWPIDDRILERIIRMLYFSDRLHFAATCRHWRNRIYRLPATWEDIAIIPKRPFDNSLIQYITAFKMRHLSICTDNGLPYECTRHWWNQLESLEIVTRAMGRSIGSVDLARALVIQNSTTLKQLEVILDTVDLYPYDIFNDLLWICPNLTRLKLHKHPQPFPRDAFDWLRAPAHPIPLTQLTLVNSDLNWLTRLIPKCPQLQHIVCVPRRLRPDDHQVLEFANHFCPYLQSFRVGEIDHLDTFPDNSLVYKLDNAQPMDCVNTVVSCMDHGASRFLKRNHLTLEGLSLSLECLQPCFMTLVTLAQLNVPRLRKLDLSRTTSSTPYLTSHDLTVIMQHCPALETLWIANAIIVNDNVLYSLHRLKRLSTLEMTIMQSLDVDHGVSSSGLDFLFSTAPCLQNVHLILKEGVSVTSCLLSIARSRTLIHLQLTYQKHVTLTGLEEFATGSCAPLQTLKIQSIDGLVGMENDSLAPLLRMPYFKQVELSPCLPSLKVKVLDSMSSFKNKVDITTKPIYTFGPKLLVNTLHYAHNNDKPCCYNICVYSKEASY